MFATSGTFSDWTEIDTGVWFAPRREMRSGTVHEQFLQQANGYRLTMLTIESEDEEEVEDEDDLQNRWTARFRK
jgi:hypothetical protein